jgi:outer membrane immunogenic protein
MTITRSAAYLVGISLLAAGNAWAAVEDWTGIYGGATAGAGVAHADLRTSVKAPGNYFLIQDIQQIGDIGPMTAMTPLWTGGVQAGYNLQRGRMVYGVEADLSAFELKGSRTVTQRFNSDPGGGTSFAIEQTVRTDWLLTVRPRVGVAVSDFFIYGTAGLAETRIKYTERYTDTFNPGLASDSTSKTKPGWTAGAGCEYAMNDRWSFKGEYLYADFGRVSGSSGLMIPAGLGDKFDHSVVLHTHLIRVGLNYKFGPYGFGLNHPAPAVKYKTAHYEDPVDAPIYSY